MIDQYKSIVARSEGFYREKGSKFIGIALPVNTEEDFKSKLLSIKKEYHDARHHCYAYVLGPEGNVFRANDDGEPGHSAGDPILGQIKSLGLSDTAVVVVRYFGGTKLGVSGLINAYKSAAGEALASSKIVIKDVRACIMVNFSYDSTADILKLVKEFSLKLEEERYDERSTLRLSIIASKTELLIAQLGLLQEKGHDVQFSPC